MVDIFYLQLFKEPSRLWCLCRLCRARTIVRGYPPCVLPEMDREGMLVPYLLCAGKKNGDVIGEKVRQEALTRANAAPRYTCP